MANTNWCYVAYFDGVERVQIIKKRVSSRGLPRDIKNPVLVRDEDGDEFVVGDGELHNNPMQASLAMAKMAKQLGNNAPRANPIRGPDDEEEDEEADDEDEDELDDEEDLDEDDLDEDEEDEEDDED